MNVDYTDKKETFTIEARGLVKTFGDKHAVDGVDLNVHAGTIYGVLST